MKDGIESENPAKVRRGSLLMRLLRKRGKKRRQRRLVRARHRRIRDRLRRGGINPSNALSRRIVAFNLIGLGLLVAGVLYLNQFRSGLIDQRTLSLETQGWIIAAAIADAAAVGEGGVGFDPVRANAVLARLTRPTGARARIFDRNGRLIGDSSRMANGIGAVETSPLDPPDAAWLDGVLGKVAAVYAEGVAFFVGKPRNHGLALPGEITKDPEVWRALDGEAKRWERLNEDGELLVSVAVPVQRFKAVLSVLTLTTEGGDIDEIVRAERMQILQVFLVALAISLTLSVLLANTIAKPIRRLAEAAEAGGAQDARPLNPQRIRFPDMADRSDEIGYLSSALRRMTEALYDRIDAIESFAADVAHEIKNPLTSLRSAVETLSIARTPEMQEKLLTVIQNDVTRLDRLVTDISNASRLDAELVREEMAPFDLAALIEAMAEMNQKTATEREVRLENPAVAGGVMVRGLQGRIGQVVQNLITNAISFSRPGDRVRVGLERRASSVRILVEDQGPGIPDANLGSIFERFYSERPDHEAFGNHSGLGLSISRQIVEAHGGSIWADNLRPLDDPKAPPAGARFTVELPL